MNKLVKILLAVLVVFVLLLAGVLVAAKLLVTPERVRATLIPLAERSLERKIELGEIEVGLFSGVSLADVKLYDPQGREVFVAAERGVLKYRFWPLLLGRVVIDQVRLVAPTITLERFADGHLNLAPAPASAIESNAAQPAASAPVEPAAPSKATPIDLLVTEIVVERGSLLFIDHQLNPQAPYRYQIEQLELRARDVSFSRAFPVSLAAQVNGASLQLQGQLDLARQSSDLQLDINRLDLTAFAPYLRDRLPGLLSRAVLSAQLAVQTGPERVSAKGKLLLDQVSLQLDALKGAPLRDARLASEFDLAYDLPRATLHIASLGLNYNQVLLRLQGSLSQLTDKPAAELSLDIEPLGVRALLDSLPPELVTSLAGLDPAGTIHGQLQLRGSLAQPLNLLQQGDVVVSGLQANLGSLRPSLDGRFKFDPTRLQSEGLTLTLGDQRASLDLQISPLLQGRPLVRCNVQSEQLALDPLLQGAAGGGGVAAAAPGEGTPPTQANASKAAGVASSQDAAPLDLPVDAQGEIRIGRSSYHGLELTDLAIDYRLARNVLTLSRITGQLAGGSLAQTARIDLGKPGWVYQSDLQLEKVQAGTLVKAFAPDFQGVVSGGLSIKSSLSGQGTIWEKLRDQLVANGDLRLEQFGMSNLPLAVALADYLQVEELRKQAFDLAEGTFKIVKGKLQLDADLTGQQLALKPQGTIGLDGGLKLSLPTRLSPQVAGRLDQRGKFTGLLADADGWVTLPLKLGGSWAAPEFTVDARQLRKQVINKAGEQLQEQLLKKLAPPAAPDAPADPQRKLLEKTLRGLLGQ